MLETASFVAMAGLQLLATVGLWRNGLRWMALASAAYGVANLCYAAIAYANIKRPGQ